MKSKLPSPFSNTAPSSVGLQNSTAGSGVSGFTFLSQPSFESPRHMQAHSQVRQFGSQVGPTRHKHFQPRHNSYHGGREGSNFSLHSSPNVPRVNNRGSPYQRGSPYGGHFSPNLSNSYNGSPFHQKLHNNSRPLDRSFQSPYNSPNSSYHTSSPFQSPATGRAKSGSFIGGRGQGRGRGRYHSSLGNIPIEKFVSYSLFEDPWAPSESHLSLEQRNFLKKFDEQFLGDCNIKKHGSDKCSNQSLQCSSEFKGTSTRLADKFKEAWQ